MGAAIIILLMSAGLVGGVIDTITGLVVEYGYPAVFVAALLEVIFPPIPSEVVYPLVGFTVQSRGLGLGNAFGMAATGALGSTVGAVFIYFISMKVGRAAIVRFGRHIKVSEHEIEKAEKLFAKYGPIAVFTARMIPAIREIISIPAGIGRMNLVKFIAYTFAGSFVWSVILTLAGYYLGEAWSSFSAQASRAFTIISTILIVAIVAGIVVWYTRRIRGHAKESY